MIPCWPPLPAHSPLLWLRFCFRCASVSASASAALFDYLINGLGRRLLRKQTTALFYGWLIKQSGREARGVGQRQGLSRGRLGGMPQTPVQRFSHDSSDDVADTAAGHGNWDLGSGVGMGTRLGKRQMSMSQPKIQKWRAKSDAKKKTKRKARNEKRQNETQRR